MITKEEYLKAKAIVDQYEQDEWEEGCRKADIELSLEEDEDEEFDDGECQNCGRAVGRMHYCSRCDPDSYENCGYG